MSGGRKTRCRRRRRMIRKKWRSKKNEAFKDFAVSKKDNLYFLLELMKTEKGRNKKTN